MYKVYQLIYKKIQESLKSYIKGGEIDEKTTLQSLEITLTNVRIKKSALRSLMIPLVVQNTSKIKSLSLSISTGPKLKLIVEGLYLALNPSSLKHLNSEYLQNQKFIKLEKWEKNQKEMLKTTGSFGKKLAEWLVPSLLANVKVELRNFTLIYQDSQNLQILGFPCLAIVKIESLTVRRKENCDDKNIQLGIENISVILRCDPVHYEKGTSIGSIYDEMKISERSYLLRPCSITGCFKPPIETIDNSVSTLKIEMKNDVHIAINEYQRMFIEGFINFLENSSKANRYSFFKPKTSVKSSPGEWWKFLIYSLKHDLRFNINKVIRMQNTKAKYIEMYKRVQTIIKAPVLIKLSRAEEAEMRSIEENLMFEEIVEFRTQALEQIKEKVNSKQKSNKKETEEKVNSDQKSNKNEKTKNYFKDYFEEFKDHEYESGNETSEEIENSKPKNSIHVDFTISRIIFSINLLKSYRGEPLKFLDTEGCKCGRCPKDPEEEMKSTTNSKSRSLKVVEIPERAPIISERKMIRHPNEYSLLPNRKMKDVIIEYGDEIFKIGSLCYKSRGGEAYEPNIVKEITLVLFLIDNINLTVNNHKKSKNVVVTKVKVANIYGFDPLLCACPDLNYKTTETIRSLQELMNFSGWFDFIFRFKEENKAHWAFRYFMKDQNALPEFEFWLHFLENEHGNDFCLCGLCYKTEQAFKDVFLFNENVLNNIHYNNSKKMPNLNFTSGLMKSLADKIKMNIIKNFPFYLQVSLRYFISSIYPKSFEQHSMKLRFEFTKDKEENAVLIKALVQSLPLQLTTHGLSCLKIFLSSDKTSMHEKSIYKKNFIETLQNLPKRLLMIKHIMNNVERSTRIVEALNKTKLDKFPKFTVDLSVKELTFSLNSLLASENLKTAASFSVVVNDLKVTKDLMGSFRDSDISEKSQNASNYITFKSSISSLVLQSPSEVVKSPSEVLRIEYLQLVGNFNPFIFHPYQTSLYIDIHARTIKSILDSNLMPLVHVLNSLAFQISEIELYSFNQIGSNNFRLSDSDVMSELQQAIDDFREKQEKEKEEKAKAKEKDLKYRNEKRNTKDDLKREEIKKEESAKKEKKNFLEENLKTHDLPNDHCKHCVIRHLKLLFSVHFAVGSMDESQPDGLFVQLKDSQTKYFELTCKHLLAKVEEGLTSSKVSVISAKFIGKSPSRDSVFVLPSGSKIQPVIHANHQQFFPLTLKFYLSSASIFGYQLAVITRNLLKKTEDETENISEFKRSHSNVTKIKIPDIEVHDYEVKTRVLVESFIVNLNLKSKIGCRLIEGLGKLATWVKLATCLIAKKNFKVFTVKYLRESLIVSVANLNLAVSIGNLDVECLALDILLNVKPVTVSPPFNQLLFKGKDTEADITYQTSVKVKSIEAGLKDVLKVFIDRFEFSQSDMRHAKGKVVNKIFTCSSSNLIEKLDIKVESLKVSSEGTELLLIPGELRRNTLIKVDGKHIEIRNDRSEVWHINFPQVSVFFQIELLKKILSLFLSIPKINLKTSETEQNFIKDLNLLHKTSKNTRLCLFFSNLYLLLECRKYLILTLKLHQITLFHNLPQSELESQNLSNVKEIFNDISYINTTKDELVLICRNFEVIPNDSIYRNIIESKTDFCLSIKINTQVKTINIFAFHKIKAVIINKVFEELLLSLKDLKSVKPKKSEPDRDNFEVFISIEQGEVIIPRHSNSRELAKISFNSGRVHVSNADQKIRKPLAPNQNSQVFNEKEVMLEGYEDSSTVYCDLVEVHASNANIQTIITNKKRLGTVKHIQVFIKSPSLAEELQSFSWKTDSIVDVEFINAELTASLAYFLKLQKLFEDNFDEDVTLFPKVKKLQKLNLNFSIGESEIEIQSIEVKPKEEKSIEKDPFLPDIQISSSLQEAPFARLSEPKRSNSNQFGSFYNNKEFNRLKAYKLDLPKASEASNEESLN